MGSQRVRIAVVGGGPSGAAAAIILARRGMDAVVLESLAAPAPKVGECLPPNINPLLHELGLTDGLHRDGHLLSFGNRSVWGTAASVDRHFLCGTHGQGWHLDRQRFESLLAEVACNQGADWRYGHRFDGCRRREGTWEVRVRTSGGVELLSADYLIDATGRSARLARSQGARRFSYDRLVGVAATLWTDGRGDVELLTLVEAVATGWWYSAPLPEGGLTVVYLTDGDLLDHGALRLEGLQALLEKAGQTLSRVRRGGYRLARTIRVVPANTCRMAPVAGEGWFAVGDAATAYDPLSSYGIGWALGTGYHAAQAIAATIEGRAGADAAYSSLIDRAFDGFLVGYRGWYALEDRWASEPFWNRRRHPFAGAV